MPQIQVLFAPYTEVAFVTMEGVKDPFCWAVSPKWGCRDENAPHLFNAHQDSAREAVAMEDEHPFPQVLSELERRIDALEESNR